MKTLLKIIAIAIVLLGIETNSFAQLTINPSASGTIVQTITFLKLFDLDFGNMAVTGVGGTCILDPMAGANPNRTITGGVTLPSFIGTPRAAAFTVTGVPGEYFTITILQVGIQIYHTTVPAEFMDVDQYTCDQQQTAPDMWRQQLDVLNGDATFYVGATCTVHPNQLAGLYTNAAGFPVTVNYE
jgi:hypothetical protein